MELLISPPPWALYTAFPMSEQSNSRNFQLLRWRYPTELNVRTTRVIFNFLAATLKKKWKETDETNCNNIFYLIQHTPNIDILLRHLYKK